MNESTRAYIRLAAHVTFIAVVLFWSIIAYRLLTGVTLIGAVYIVLKLHSIDKNLAALAGGDEF